MKTLSLNVLTVVSVSVHQSRSVASTSV